LPCRLKGVVRVVSITAQRGGSAGAGAVGAARHGRNETTAISATAKRVTEDMVFLLAK
jgi:hypothetical protein